MIPDRMGIIGNTQGVKASSRPMPKKLATTSQALSRCNMAAIRSCSASGWSSAADRVCVTAIAGVAAGPTGAAAAVPSAGSCSFTRLFCGG